MSGCFGAVTPELRSFKTDHVAHKVKNICYVALIGKKKKKIANPWSKTFPRF